MTGDAVDFREIDGTEAGRQLDEYGAMYAEVYGEPPYEWGLEHEALFRRRFETQRLVDGFAFVEASEAAFMSAWTRSRSAGRRRAWC